MIEKWTGVLIGKMHNAGVTYEELAKELNCGKPYVSMILNGKRTPPNAKARLENAFNSLLEKRKK